MLAILNQGYVEGEEDLQGTEEEGKEYEEEMEEEPTAELSGGPVGESFEEVAAVQRLSSEGMEKRLVHERESLGSEGKWSSPKKEGAGKRLGGEEKKKPGALFSEGLQKR